MKDTILHSALIATVAAALLFAVAGNVQFVSPASAAGASRTFAMEKTVVTAKRLPASEADAPDASRTFQILVRRDQDIELIFGFT